MLQGRDQLIQFGDHGLPLRLRGRVGNGQCFSNPDLEPGNFVMNIPIHFRINIEVYKIFCIGLKATYNIPVEKYYIDRGTALIYFAFKI